MSNLQIIEHQEQRVLTTQQLAEAYGVDSKMISKNFERNRERYQLGKHYFALQGDDLRTFKANRQIDDSLKFASILYIWTEKGAWLHAKSLNTDEAWNAYEMLVDDYFTKNEMIAQLHSLSPEVRALINIELQQKKLESQVTSLENSVHTITTHLIETPDHTKVVDLVNEYARWERIGHNEVYTKVYQILKDKHGIDVPLRVENERQKINMEYFQKTGKYYAQATLRKKINGIDVMVHMGVLDKFHSILVGLVSLSKSRNFVGVAK